LLWAYHNPPLSHTHTRARAHTHTPPFDEILEPKDVIRSTTTLFTVLETGVHPGLPSAVFFSVAQSQVQYPGIVQ